MPVNAETAAFHLGVTPGTLDNLIRDNPDFPMHRIGSSAKAHRRFYRSELDAWLRRGTIEDLDGNGDKAAS